MISIIGNAIVIQAIPTESYSSIFKKSGYPKKALDLLSLL